MRIISINALPPYPPTFGGLVRTFNLLDRLRRRHELTTLCFCRSAEDLENVRWLTDHGWDVRAAPFARLQPSRPQSWPALARHLAAAFGGRPAGVTHWDQPAMRDVLAAVAPGADVIQAEEGYLGPYLLRTTRGARRILTALDVYTVTLSRRLAFTTGWRARWSLRREIARFRRYESRISSQVDRVLAMSEVDADILRGLNPAARVAVVPNGIDTIRLQPGPIAEHGHRLLFVGSPLHQPNIDAAVWLLTEIWPRILQCRPDASLTLVYMNVPAVTRLAEGQANVRVTSRILDMVPLYREADLCLAPIRIGSGTRFKILEAMALAAPVLSTTIGAEGLAAQPGEHFALADTAEAFAAAAVALLADVDRRRRLAEAGRRLVEARYEWNRIVEQLEQVYRETEIG